MTDDELAAIERRCRMATPGPWESDNTAPEYSAILAMVNGGWEDLLCADNRVADAALMASARSDVPALVAEVRRLRGVLEQIANAGQWSAYHGRDVAAWMATTAKVALREQGYAE